MGKVIAISTNKGGVLKTSITTNLAGAMSKKAKVLLIDTDNQGNCLLSFGKNPDTADLTIYDVLVNGTRPIEAIQHVYKNIDVLPANDDMTFFELDVLSNGKKYPQPFQLMRKQLEPIRDKYDYILIDTPPNLGLTQANVLSFADSVIIPFQPENYSMRSLVKIVKAINEFKEQQNPGLTIIGVLATLVDSRTVLHSQVLQEARKFCAASGIYFFETVIPRTVRYAANIAYERLPTTLADAKHQAAITYSEILKEVKKREKN